MVAGCANQVASISSEPDASVAFAARSVPPTAVGDERADAAPNGQGRTPEPTSAGRACPDDMVEVEGDFCPEALEECLRWIDKDHQNPGGAVDPNMCAEFRSPSRCRSKERVPMHFCIDRYEWPNRPGEVPATAMSWLEAKAACEGAGKRLCNGEEWTFACEGEAMKPYPYGDGYHRDSSACNMDVNPWMDPVATPFARLDKRTPSGAFASCQSDTGVFDLTGNVDEWVYNESGSPDHVPYVSGLMGGHWVHGVRNRCRAITVTHEPHFSFYVTGTRCCTNASD